MAQPLDYYHDPTHRPDLPFAHFEYLAHFLINPSQILIVSSNAYS